MNRAFVPRVNFERATFEGRFHSAWSKSDELFGLIKEDQISIKPIVWRHPFIFYVGHLPAFTWNQTCGGLLSWQSFNPYFDDLFCRGIDPDIDTGECHWHPDVPETWPELKNGIKIPRPGSFGGLGSAGCDATSGVLGYHGSTGASFRNGSRA